MAAAPDIPTLVRQLRGGSRITQLRAAAGLSWILARNEQFNGVTAEMQREVAAAGGIQAAVELLHSNMPAVRQEAAARACFQNRACVAALVAAGGIPALVGLLQASGVDTDDQLRWPICVLSSAMDVSPAGVDAAVAACGGTVQLSALLHGLLQGLLQRGAPPNWWPAVVHMLTVLAKCKEEYAATVASCGVIETLVRQLQLPQAASLKAWALLAVIETLEALSTGSTPRSAAIEAAGAVPAAVHCLRHSSPAVQFRATQLLSSLLHSCPHLQAGILEAGGAEAVQQLTSSRVSRCSSRHTCC